MKILKVLKIFNKENFFILKPMHFLVHKLEKLTIKDTKNY